MATCVCKGYCDIGATSLPRAYDIWSKRTCYEDLRVMKQCITCEDTKYGRVHMHLDIPRLGTFGNVKFFYLMYKCDLENV